MRLSSFYITLISMDMDGEPTHVSCHSDNDVQVIYNRLCNQTLEDVERQKTEDERVALSRLGRFVKSLKLKTPDEDGQTLDNRGSGC